MSERSDRSRSVYVVNTNRWLHRELTKDQELGGISFAHEAAQADFVIYPASPWPDDDAPERLWRPSLRTVRRVFVYDMSDSPLLWAPGMYASVDQRKASSSFCGAPYVVHHHGAKGLHLTPSDITVADRLWSFVGSARNHPDSRRQILTLPDPRAIRHDTEQWTRVTRWDWDNKSGAQAFDLYCDSLRRSKFVVCPRGVGVSSMRIFEAMQTGRCPVIVADGWTPPPFVDWATCSITLPEHSVSDLPGLLRLRESEAAALGSAARLMWLEHFAPEHRLRYLVDAASELAESGQATLGRRLSVSSRAAFSRPMFTFLRRWAAHQRRQRPRQ